MFCFYCDKYMGDIEYIDVIHEHQNKKKKYYKIPRYKCSCGTGRVPKEIYEFMNENMDNNKQLNDKNDKDEPRYEVDQEVKILYYCGGTSELTSFIIVKRFLDGKGYLYGLGYKFDKRMFEVVREEDIIIEEL